MIRKHLKHLLACAGAFVGIAAPRAHAVPITGQYIEDPRCDPIPTQQLTHELGAFLSFPINEAFTVSVQKSINYICVPDDGIANDWQVEIFNISGQAWKNLFFVGNLGMRVGNADGNMIDVVGAAGVVTDAFRIDGTVTAGVNNNLIFESGTVNEIFEPGETWRFLVTNFVDNQGLNPPPNFTTPGQFAGSSPINPSTASILATPVPEPTGLGLFCVTVSVLMLRRPRHAPAANPS